MSFNPDPNKQANEVVFSRKISNKVHPPVNFNGTLVTQVTCQKHLGMYLDKSLNFNRHLEEKLMKVSKGIGVLRKPSSRLPRKALITIYKSFIRPHLDYGDIICDQPHNESLCQKNQT